jgi:hypothetical protein
MEEVVPVVKRNAYHHNVRTHLLDPIFHLFLTQDDSTYMMREVQARCKVPTMTLYSWRERVRSDPEWRPAPEHFSENARLFIPDENRHPPLNPPIGSL